VNEENAEEMGENGPLTAEIAMDLLGWQEEGDEEGVKWGSKFKFTWDSKKVRLLNNPTNRPFRKGLALRYANEILRGEWQLNGEPIIIDRYGRVQSGQHRLAAIIFAQTLLKDDIEKWSEYGWKDNGMGVFIEAVGVFGIDPSPKVVDTIDIGQKRTLGDVVFRNDEFGGNEKVMAKLSNVLSHATRLVWLRAGGQKVSDAPHFPHSEALNFIEQNPKLKECVKFIADAEGTGKEGKRISKYVSLGYAAGTMYLMATSGTDKEALDAGEGELNFDMLDKAKDFWQFFASHKDLPTGNAIRELRMRLSEISAGDGAGRDEIVGTIAKAFNAWVDGKTFAPNTLKLKRKENEEEGWIEITEDPRMGGLDTDLEAK
jgi:hypothetical protein